MRYRGRRTPKSHPPPDDNRTRAGDHAAHGPQRRRDRRGRVGLMRSHRAVRSAEAFTLSGATRPITARAARRRAAHEPRLAARTRGRRGAGAGGLHGPDRRGGPDRRSARSAGVPTRTVRACTVRRDGPPADRYSRRCDSPGLSALGLGPGSECPGTAAATAIPSGAGGRRQERSPAAAVGRVEEPIRRAARTIPAPSATRPAMTRARTAWKATSSWLMIQSSTSQKRPDGRPGRGGEPRVAVAQRRP